MLSRGHIGVLALLAAGLTQTAAAQERPAPVVEFAAGALVFPDDGTVRERLIAVAARWYVSPRIGIGPEISYVSGLRHSHLILTGNLTWDILSPVSGEPRAVTPFLVAGGGLFQTREQFFVGPFTSREGAFTAGGGIRARAGDRVTLGIDARIGWELHLRLNGLVGVRLGR